MSACSCHTLIHRLKMQLKVDKSTKDSPFAHKILAAESWWKLQAAILGISPFITSCFVEPIWYTFTSPGVVWQQNELRQKLLHDLVPSYVASLELIPSNSCSVWLNKWTSYWPLRSRRVGESQKLFYFSFLKKGKKKMAIFGQRCCYVHPGRRHMCVRVLFVQKLRNGWTVNRPCI